MLPINYKYTFILSFLLLTNTDSGVLLAKNKTDQKKQEAQPNKKQVAPLPTTNVVDIKKKEKNQLESENALNRARLEKQLSTIMAEIEQLRLEKERKRLKKEIEETSVREAHEKEMRLLNMEREKLTAEIELAQAKFNKEMQASNIQIAKMDKKIQLERSNTQLLQAAKDRLQAEIDSLKVTVAREKHIQKKPIYLKDPLRKEDNILVLSDRVIELNCVILPWTASRVVDQIQYFNNKNSTHPIFIVIDQSPGGSVLAGWDILQAMERSKAPVYVVVKRYAASMAALITTLANKSYIYPNAIILHHQPYCWGGGNVREQKESYEFIEKVWQRLGGKVAKKMGISLKEFEKRLYEKSMYGDWREYGDSAIKIKWADSVIIGVEDSGRSTFPDEADYTFEKFIKKYYGCNMQQGGELPAEAKEYYALNPHDFDYSYRSRQQRQVIVK